MEPSVPSESLLGRLKQVPDPRRRQGRVYPQWSTLGLLIVAALNGETSLRGMWQWGRQHWRQISRPLRFTGQRCAPSYGMIWYLLSRLDVTAVERGVQAWVQGWADEAEVFSLDSKVLRGSRRTDPTEPALVVVTVAAQHLKVVLGQEQIKEPDQVNAAIELLRTVPMAGKLVTADAGLLRRRLAKTIIKAEGDYLGPLKDNEALLNQVVNEWVAAQLSPPGAAPPSRLPPGQ